MRPMLAAKIQEDWLCLLDYPIIVSPKIDGIRALIHSGRALSRTSKLIRNTFVQNLAACLPHGFDGELTYSRFGKISSFRDTTSNIMSTGGSPNFTYNVFDSFSHPRDNFTVRYYSLQHQIDLEPLIQRGLLAIVEQVLCNDKDEILLYEEKCLNKGYEGIILRKPFTTYKFNRSTLREQKLLKLKRFQDDEAKIIGFQELFHNANEAKLNNLGLTEHSKDREGLIPMNILGALIACNSAGVTFNIGSGFTEAERLTIWAHRDHYQNRLVKYKYFAASGDYDKPRHPVFLGFRSEDDVEDCKEK